MEATLSESGGTRALSTVNVLCCEKCACICIGCANKGTDIPDIAVSVMAAAESP